MGIRVELEPTRSAHTQHEPFLLRQPCCLIVKSCLTLRPYGLQPARLLRPWDSPGKNTGVGCHCLFQGFFPIQGWNPSLLRWHRGSKTTLGHAGRVSEVSLASPPLSSDGSTHLPLQHSHCLGSTWKRPFRLLLPPLFQLPPAPASWGPPLPALSVGIRRPEIAWCRRAACCGLGMTPYRTKCRSSWVRW